VAFTVASAQLLVAAVISLSIQEEARCMPRLRAVPGER
jgi:hypothetical protein